MRGIGIGLLLVALLALVWTLRGRPEDPRAPDARASVATSPSDAAAGKDARATAPAEDVALARGRVAGVVRSADGPVAGARVKLRWVDGPDAERWPVEATFGTQESASDGAYAFAVEDEYLPCDVRLEVRAEGFAAVLTPPFRLDAGRVRDVELAPERTIEGHVVTAAGEAPSPWVRVVARSLAEPDLLHVSKTDENGRFRIGGLPSGRYRLRLLSGSWRPENATTASAGARDVRVVVSWWGMLQVRAWDIEEKASIDDFTVFYEFAGLGAGTLRSARGECKFRVEQAAAVGGGTIRVEALGYVTVSRPANFMTESVAMYRDRGPNLTIAVRYRDGGALEGEPTAYLLLSPSQRLPLALERAGPQTFVARAPDSSGLLRVRESGVLAGETVQKRIDRPLHVDVEMERPGEIVFRVPDVDQWFASCTRNGRAVHDFELVGRSVRARPGRWEFSFLPATFTRDSLDQIQDVEFDLAPGGRVVVSRVGDRLVARDR